MVGMNGFNVGVDAHIDPQPHAITLSVEWETVKFYHSTNNCVFVRFRVDVGIDPYIHAGLRSIQRTALYRDVSGGW